MNDDNMPERFDISLLTDWMDRHNLTDRQAGELLHLDHKTIRIMKGATKPLTKRVVRELTGDGGDNLVKTGSLINPVRYRAQRHRYGAGRFVQWITQEGISPSRGAVLLGYHPNAGSTWIREDRMGERAVSKLAHLIRAGRATTQRELPLKFPLEAVKEAWQSVVGEKAIAKVAKAIVKGDITVIRVCLPTEEKERFIGYCEGKSFLTETTEPDTRIADLLSDIEAVLNKHREK